jgi:hypothetical protein
LKVEQKTSAQAKQAWIYRAIVSGSALLTQQRVKGEAVQIESSGQAKQHCVTRFKLACRVEKTFRLAV